MFAVLSRRALLVLDVDVVHAAQVVATEGVAGLFAGLQGRVVWSVLFSAIGFTLFEAAKEALGLDDEDAATKL